MISADDLRFVTEILLILEVFDKMTKVVSSEDTVTISKVLSVKDFLINKVDCAEFRHRIQGQNT